MSKLGFLIVALIMALAMPLNSLYGAGHLSSYKRQILASVLINEGASEGVRGMQAILNVIYNRADQRVDRVIRVTVKRGQFSSLNSVTRQRHPNYSPYLRRAQRDRLYQQAYRLVNWMERGLLSDITGGAIYFHTVDINPYWASSMTRSTTIGRHIFYVC